MYQPEKYQKQDPEYIYRFIQEHPFATFVMKGSKLVATHIPVLTEGDARSFRLFSHIANHNEQKELIKEGAEALFIFQGPHAYISSSWYQEKDISTWDYSAVHVNARIYPQSRNELENSLEKLVRHFEKEQEKPLYYEDLPNKMLEEHLPLITGFWIEPTEIQAIAKFNQSYGKEDIQSVCKHLEKKDDPLAKQVSKNIRKEHDQNH